MAGLTVPYVKRIDDNVGIQEITASLKKATRQISEAIGALPPAEEEEQKAPKLTAKSQK